MKKILSVSMLFILLGVFLAGDISYAAAPKGITPEGRNEAEKRLDDANAEADETDERKGSIYDAISYFIGNGYYEENAILKKYFAEHSGVNPETREPYSDTTILREINSSLAVGLLEQDLTGKLFIPAGLNMDALEAINTEVQKIITTKEAGTDEALGLKRYNLSDLPAETIGQIKTIVEDNLLTNNKSINLVTFPASFAEEHGETLLGIVNGLRGDQQAVIIIAPGQELSVIPGLQAKITAQEILTEEVAPDSAAAEDFRQMFANQNFAGLAGTIDDLKLSIQQGAVAK